MSDVRSIVFEKVGTVVVAFNQVEEKIDFLITNYFNINNESEKDFFKNYLLNTSITNFGSKIKLLEKILNKKNISDVNETVNKIRRLNSLRNIFAHCSIKYEQTNLEENESKNPIFDKSKKADVFEIEPLYLESYFYGIYDNNKVSLKEEKLNKLFKEFKKLEIEIDRILNDIKPILLNV